MEHLHDNELAIMDDRRAFVAAAAAVARADEAMIYLVNDDSPFECRRASWCRLRTLRNEATAIAGLEGHAVRAESLCRRIGDQDASNFDRATKLAADFYDALILVETWPTHAPSLQDVLKLFTVSDQSTGRVMRPDLVWTLEDDAAWLQRECEVVADNKDPWTAIEVIRRIWTSGRFQGTARRMAMLSAPWILARGFDCQILIHGITQQIRKDVDGYRDAAKAADGWALVMAQAISEVGRVTHKNIGDAAAERASLLAICPPERSSSSVGSAVEFIIGQPIFTVKSFCQALGVTPRGAKVILDKLETAGLLEVEGGSRNRNYVCRRAI